MRKVRQTVGLLAGIVVMLLPACAAPSPSPGQHVQGSLILATTTSTQDSGLLDELLPAFTSATQWQVKTVAVGSGQALELGRRGEADVLLVHSPGAEEKFMAEGTAGRRLLVMHNDFVLLGPVADPAGIRGRPVREAMTRIAGSGSLFVSRSDESGTHAREKELWSNAGIKPAGAWYQATGQGMGATLRVADEKAGYTLADRGTYLAQRESLGLGLLSEGDPRLLNVYHVIEMSTRAGQRVQPDGAAAFADWIVSPPAQNLIGKFGRDRFGQPLFTPDAGKPEPVVGG